jgi:hypothetical protein
MPNYQHLNLERNFWSWLAQAQSDFRLIGEADDLDFISEQARQKLALPLNVSELRKRLGLVAPSLSVVAPKSHLISEPAKPWKA